MNTPIPTPCSGCPTDKRYSPFCAGPSTKPCGCGDYCVMAAHAERYEKMCGALNGPWAAPKYSALVEPLVLQFSGVELELTPDGTYSLGDTTGG